MSPATPRKTALDRDLVIAGLVRIARPLMLQANWVADSCLPTTRVAIKVLGHFGIEAKPLVVRVRAMNKVGAEHMERCERLNMKALPPRYAWKVDIGYEAVDGKFGHLVAIVARELIDLSIDQVTRLDKDLVASPIRHSVSRAFLEGSAPTRVLFEGGTQVLYEALPDDATYLSLPAWLDEGAQDPLVRLIVDKIEALADASASRPHERPG